jgi:hypothetical protein
MAKLVAIASVLASLGCGAGSNDGAPFRREASKAALLPGPCTNTPQDCGLKICVDCTADAPPGTEADCVRATCIFRCAVGFHGCGAGCVPVDDPGACGPACTRCSAPPQGDPLCTAGACDFACHPGFIKIAGGCVSQSFSSSY